MLKFNTQKLIKDLMKEIDKELDKVAKSAVEYMVYEIASLPERGSHDSVGDPEWRRDVIESLKFVGKIQGLNVIKQIGLINANELQLNRALLINYGMGKSLFTKNPYLQEYLSSEYYDSNRNGFKVYTRPNEMVYDYHTGSWKRSTANSRYEIENFWQNPSLFFENGLRLVQYDFNKAIETVIDKFNFSKYLESTIKK